MTDNGNPDSPVGSTKFTSKNGMKRKRSVRLCKNNPSYVFDTVILNTMSCGFYIFLPARMCWHYCIL